MAWWQLWRRSNDSATVSNSGASPETSGHVDDGPLAAIPATADPTPMIHRVPDAEPSATVGLPREPQGWRLLPPPELLAHKAMPVTANMAVQRSLAAHIPVPQLAVTSRPLGHERRADGPIGTVASVMRTVSASVEALLPATHVSGSDLVLRRKVAIGEGLPTEEHPAQTPRPRPSSIGPVAEGSPSPVSLMSASEPGREPPPEPIALRALGATSPLLSDFPPVTSLTSASSFAAPSLAGSAASSLIARTPADSGTPESASPSDMPVTARQRRVIEVRSATEPVSLSAFAASPAPATPSVVARTADGISMPSADSDQFAPRPHSGDDVDADDESSAGPSLSAIPEIRPTVGRRVGLGMPMNALPSSAISRVPESDPFAGWNEPEMPLVLGSSSSTGSVEGGISGVAFGTAGEDVRGFTPSSGAPDSTTVRRAKDAALPGSGAAPSSQSAARGTASVDANGSTSTRPESSAMPALVLSDPVEHAPLLGHRRLDRTLDESLAPVSVAGTERPVTPVRVRWGTGSDAPAAGSRTEGGPGPASPITRSVDAPSDSSSPSGSGRSARTHAAGPEPIVGSSRIVNRSALTGPVSSGHASSALTAQSPTEHPVRSPAPLGTGGGIAQQPLVGVGLPANSGTATTAPADLGSSDGSAAASETSDFRTIERSEDAPVVPLRPWQDTTRRQSLLDAGPRAGAAFGQEAGPLLRSPDSSVGQATPLPVVNVNRTPVPSSSPAALMLQRESQPGSGQASGQSNTASPSSEQATGASDPEPGPASNGAGGAPGGSGSDAGNDSAAGGAAAGASGATSAQADAELDRLAGKLYERIRQRVRRELLDDRERAGFSLDGIR